MTNPQQPPQGPPPWQQPGRPGQPPAGPQPPAGSNGRGPLGWGPPPHGQPHPPGVRYINGVPYMIPVRPDPTPSPKRKVVVLAMLAAAALGFIGSVITPIVYPTGQSWSGGTFLWQWTPHLLGGSETEFVVALFVVYLIATLVSSIGAMLALAGVMGRVPSLIWTIAVIADALISAFMLLILAASVADDRISSGPAVWLNLAGVGLAIACFATKKHRLVWQKDKPF
ncbi:hypothetical protein ACQB6R_12440 [Propionibacteriaceae bacterium G1746]|uniref:hypothetical protein n=1 Tax=Aestuariimicrobium sp. G57 TaxID=3418485 RepID=UPI003C19D6C6